MARPDPAVGADHVPAPSGPRWWMVSRMRSSRSSADGAFVPPVLEDADDSAHRVSLSARVRRRVGCPGRRRARIAWPRCSHACAGGLAAGGGLPECAHRGPARPSTVAGWPRPSRRRLRARPAAPSRRPRGARRSARACWRRSAVRCAMNSKSFVGEPKKACPGSGDVRGGEHVASRETAYRLGMGQRARPLDPLGDAQLVRERLGRPVAPVRRRSSARSPQARAGRARAPAPRRRARSRTSPPSRYAVTAAARVVARYVPLRPSVLSIACRCRPRSEPP